MKAKPLHQPSATCRTYHWHVYINGKCAMSCEMKAGYTGIQRCRGRQFVNEASFGVITMSRILPGKLVHLPK